MVGVWLFRQTFVWTPLQQFYLSAYGRSALASSLGIRTGRYRVLLMENRRGDQPVAAGTQWRDILFLSFEKDTIVQRAVFDNEGKVTGLVFRPTDLAVLPANK